MYRRMISIGAPPQLPAKQDGDHSAPPQASCGCSGSHTYASTLAQTGVDLLTISKLLGHADTRITSRHYAHLCDNTLKAAVAKLPSFGHVPETKVQAIR